MSKLDDIKQRWHLNTISHRDILHLFWGIEEFGQQLQRQVDIYADACEERLKLKSRIGELEAKLKGAEDAMEWRIKNSCHMYYYKTGGGVDHPKADCGVCRMEKALKQLREE